ncbi:MAG: hypothetical protein AAFV07_13005 [Bacteroidota bacterium]
MRLTLSGCRPPCEPFVLQINPDGVASLHLVRLGQAPVMLTQQIDPATRKKLWQLARAVSPEKLQGLPLMQAPDQPLQILSFQGKDQAYEIRFKRVQTAELERLIKVLHALTDERAAWQSP